MMENESHILFIPEFLWRIDKTGYTQILTKDALSSLTLLFHLQAIFKKLLKYFNFNF